MSMLVNAIGMVGTVCFALSGIPQMIKSIRDQHSHGVSHGLIWLWLIGEACVFVYVLLTSYDLLLLINYVMNFLIVSTIAFYKYFPKKDA